jgi:hypothetical protein
MWPELMLYTRWCMQHPVTSTTVYSTQSLQRLYAALSHADKARALAPLQADCTGITITSTLVAGSQKAPDATDMWLEPQGAFFIEGRLKSLANNLVGGPCNSHWPTEIVLSIESFPHRL